MRACKGSPPPKGVMHLVLVSKQLDSARSGRGEVSIGHDDLLGGLSFLGAAGADLSQVSHNPMVVRSLLMFGFGLLSG